MANTQIEIALADDDRKRIDRLCRMMAVTSGKPYLAALDSTVEHLLARCTGAIKDAKDYAKRGATITSDCIQVVRLELRQKIANEAGLAHCWRNLGTTNV